MHFCSLVVVASVVEIEMAVVAWLANLGSLGGGSGSCGQLALVLYRPEYPKTEVRPLSKRIFWKRTDILLLIRHCALIRPD